VKRLNGLADLDGPSGVLVKPFLDVHLVRDFLHIVVVVVHLERVPDLLHLSPPSVHQLDDAVSGQHGEDGNKAEDDAAVDVGDFAALLTK